jgi:hypothetical protein
MINTKAERTKLQYNITVLSDDFTTTHENLSKQGHHFWLVSFTNLTTLLGTEHSN